MRKILKKILSAMLAGVVAASVMPMAMAEDGATTNPLESLVITNENSKYVTEDLPVATADGADIIWSGSDFVTADGKVNATDYTEATLTATVTVEGTDYTKEYDVVLAPAGMTTHLSSGFGSGVTHSFDTTVKATAGTVDQPWYYTGATFDASTGRGVSLKDDGGDSYLYVNNRGTATTNRDVYVSRALENMTGITDVSSRIWYVAVDSATSTYSVNRTYLTPFFGRISRASTGEQKWTYDANTGHFAENIVIDGHGEANRWITHSVISDGTTNTYEYYDIKSKKSTVSEAAITTVWDLTAAVTVGADGGGQAPGMSYDDVIVQSISKADVISRALEELDVDLSNGASLPAMTTGILGTEIALAWACTDAGVTVTDGVLGFPVLAEEKTYTVTATGSIGAYTATKDYQIVVPAWDCPQLGDIAPGVVKGASLPETVDVSGTEYTVTYAGGGNVISQSGVVAHQTKLQYVTVSPSITVDGETLTGTAQTLLVLPAYTETLLEEDFSSTFDGADFTQSSGDNSLANWYWTRGSGETKPISIVDDGESKYLKISSSSTEGSGNMNEVFAGLFDKSANDTTIIGMRVKFDKLSTANVNGVRIQPIGMFYGDRIENSGNNNSATSTIRTNAHMGGEWKNMLFVIDNTSEDENYCRNMDIYINGEKIGTGKTYVNEWINGIKVMPYRGADNTVCIDNIFAYNTTDKAYYISDISHTYQGLKSFTVKKANADEDVSYEAYAALYDATGRLVDVEVLADTDFTDGTATSNLKYSNASTMKLFVWNDKNSPLTSETKREIRQSKPTIYLFGDSIVDAKTTGWGTYMADQFKTDTVTVKNNAVSGRLASTFLSNQFLQTDVELAPGDIVLIQFGNNDHSYNESISDYKASLKAMADRIHAKGAVPVFVTPPQRNIWNGAVTSDETNSSGLYHADYIVAMRELAKELDVQLLELHTATETIMDAKGPAEFEGYFRDKNHYTDAGAKWVAGLLADLIAESDLYIKAYLNPAE